MKKIATLATLVSVISFNSFSQDATAEKNNFAARKSEIIASMNKEKSIIDSAIACINAATKKEDAEKCHEQKKSSMDALRAEREAAHEKMRAERKEKLQNELKKMDEKSAERAEKKAAKN